MDNKKKKSGVSRRRKTPLKKKSSTKESSKSLAVTGEEGVFLHTPNAPYSSAVVNTAKIMYISGKYTLKGIETKLNVNYDTLRRWQATDNWKRAKNQVIRFANKEIVRSSRKAMGVYVKNIDDMINRVDKKIQTRLSTATEEMEDEEKILKLNLEVIKLKIALMRTLSAGQGTAHIPSPGSVNLEGTGPPSKAITHLIPSDDNVLEEILESIPDYMQRAAEFVVGLSIGEKDKVISGVPEGVVVNLQGDITAEEEEELLEELLISEDDENDLLID